MNKSKYLLHGIIVVLIPLLLFAEEETRQSLYEAVYQALNDDKVIEIMKKHGPYMVASFSLEQGEKFKCTELTRRLAHTVELVLTKNEIPVYPLLAPERASLEEHCGQTLPKSLFLPPDVSSFITGTLRPMDDQVALILRVTDREGKERHRSMLSLDRGAERDISKNEQSQIPLDLTPEMGEDAPSEERALKSKVHKLIKSADNTLFGAKAVSYLQEAKSLIGDHAGFDAELKVIQDKLRREQDALELIRGDDYDF